jgi:uncharacterized protein (DUF427 family)
VGEAEVFRGEGGVRVYRREAAYADHPGGITFEPTDRWVRAKIGHTFVADSKRALLLWESGMPVPTYVFPAGDVRTDLFLPAAEPPTRRRLLASHWYDTEVDQRRLKRLAWRDDDGPLAGHVGLDWFGRREPGVEHWYEEEEEVWVHPRDPQGKNIVWTYRDPIPAVHMIKDHIAFYNEVVDITVDGAALERPQTHFNERLANDAPDTTGV